MKKLLIIITVSIFLACSTEEEYISSSKIGVYNWSENDVKIRFLSGYCSINSSYYTISPGEHLVFVDECHLEKEDDFDFTPYELEVITVDSTYVREVMKLKNNTNNISF